jgi:CRISPR-associated protein Cas1
MQKDGRVLYLTEAKDENLFWNIPIANTTVVLLGTGTSITQAAMRMLASAGVLVGFCGGYKQAVVYQSPFLSVESPVL